MKITLKELKLAVERKIRLTGTNVEVHLFNNELHIESKDGLMVITNKDNLNKMKRVLDAFAA